MLIKFYLLENLLVGLDDYKFKTTQHLKLILWFQQSATKSER